MVKPSTPPGGITFETLRATSPRHPGGNTPWNSFSPRSRTLFPAHFSPARSRTWGMSDAESRRHVDNGREYKLRTPGQSSLVATTTWVVATSCHHTHRKRRLPKKSARRKHGAREQSRPTSACERVYRGGMGIDAHAIAKHQTT